MTETRARAAGEEVTGPGNEGAEEQEQRTGASRPTKTGEVTVKMTDLMDLFRELARDEMARERLRLEDARNGRNQGSEWGTGGQSPGIETGGQSPGIETGGQSPGIKTGGQLPGIGATTDLTKVAYA